MPPPANTDEYIAAHPDREDALQRLRKVLTAAGLEETIKWGAPCYTLDGKNIVGLAAFKAYTGLWFFQGALLSDPHGVLASASDGKTKAMRQWRFESAKDIKPRLVREYIDEAIRNHRAGAVIKPDRKKPVVLPSELEDAFRRNAKARAAFAALTPGRRREYAEHVAGAKREQTRLSRVEKIIPMILAGKGLHDKYRNC